MEPASQWFRRNPSGSCGFLPFDLGGKNILFVFYLMIFLICSVFSPLRPPLSDRFCPVEQQHGADKRRQPEDAQEKQHSEDVVPKQDLHHAGVDEHAINNQQNGVGKKGDGNRRKKGFHSITPFVSFP